MRSNCCSESFDKCDDNEFFQQSKMTNGLKFTQILAGEWIIYWTSSILQWLYEKWERAIEKEIEAINPSTLEETPKIHVTVEKSTITKKNFISYHEWMILIFLCVVRRVFVSHEKRRRKNRVLEFRRMCVWLKRNDQSEAKPAIRLHKKPLKWW